jgi:hypothetical protein
LLIPFLVSTEFVASTALLVRLLSSVRAFWLFFAQTVTQDINFNSENQRNQQGELTRQMQQHRRKKAVRKRSESKRRAKTTAATS